MTPKEALEFVQRLDSKYTHVCNNYGVFWAVYENVRQARDMTLAENSINLPFTIDMPLGGIYPELKSLEKLETVYFGTFIGEFNHKTKKFLFPKYGISFSLDFLGKLNDKMSKESIRENPYDQDWVIETFVKIKDVNFSSTSVKNLYKQFQYASSIKRYRNVKGFKDDTNYVELNTDTNEVITVSKDGTRRNTITLSNLNYYVESGSWKLI